MTKTALITGASSGLGAEFASLLGEKKWNLILVARSAETLSAFGKKLEIAHSINVKTIPLDLSTHDATTLLMKEIGDTPISLLINNAGFGDFGFFQTSDPLRIRQMIDLNIGTLTDLTRAILPSMLQKGEGRILNVSSVAAFQPGPLMAVYYATKAYVLSFSEALSNELTGSGIAVTCLCPGPTKTAFANAAHMGTSKLFKRGAMDARIVAEIGLDACMKGKALIIPGWKNALGAFATRFASLSFAARMARWLQSPES